MFSRREDPNQHAVLARLSTLYTLVDLQAQHTQDPNQRFYLEAFANVLEVCTGLILMGSIGFTVYCYMQERFFNRITQELSIINYKSRHINSGTQPLQIKQSFASFFQEHKLVLDTAFTPENMLRAGI